MNNNDSEEDGIIKSYYSDEDSIYCCFGMIVLAVIIGVLPSIFLSIINGWLALIPWIIVGLIIFLIHFYGSKTYCSNCKRYVHPILTEHRCEIHFKDKKSKINKMYLNSLKNEFKQIDVMIKEISKHNIFNDDKEKEIFKKNMKSLQFFEFIGDYKYCMVSMGSIIEFLVIRYCKLNGFNPETYTDHLGNVSPASKKHFVNYIQSAIKNDILGQKNSWFIVQNNLRNFRNYVHIEKEVTEEQIDSKWYEIIKPAFDKIIESFR